jgi:hypothetical protein
MLQCNYSAPTSQSFQDAIKLDMRQRVISDAIGGGEG